MLGSTNSKNPVLCLFFWCVLCPVFTHWLCNIIFWDMNSKTEIAASVAVGLFGFYIYRHLNKSTTSMAMSADATHRSLFEYDKQKERINHIVPIVYRNTYDISFAKLQRFYVFDTEKWGKINKQLKLILGSCLKDITFLSPVRKINDDELAKVHSPFFMKSVYEPNQIANTAEIFFLKYLPKSLLEEYLLDPIKWQVAGSILAADLALHHKWAINLGGGFHHAHSTNCGGFCFFADISLIIKMLWEKKPDLKFMIVDLDAHQGNGHERDKGKKFKDKATQIYILDVYNPLIYPQDHEAKKFIDKTVEVDTNHTSDKYVELVETALVEALSDFTPDLLIYNAGTDCLAGDPLGQLNVTEDGIRERDEIVFKMAKERNIPIVMLTSGGYQRSNAAVIANSIANLWNNNIIGVPPGAATSSLPPVASIQRDTLWNTAKDAMNTLINLTSR